MTSVQDAPYAPISVSDVQNDPISSTSFGWFRERHQPPSRFIQLIRLICDTDLAIEVVMLRHEVAVLRSQVRRPLQPSDRAVLAGLAQPLPRQRLGRCFVQPVTLLRWHHDLVAKRCPPGGRPTVGRPCFFFGRWGQAVAA